MNVKLEWKKQSKMSNEGNLSYNANMADKAGHVNTDKTGIENTLEIIASELASLKYQQNETRKYLDNKITNFARDLRSDWVETLDKKINILENNIGKHFQAFDHRIIYPWL